MRPGTRLFVPSISDLIFLGCLIAALLHGSLMISADGDPGRHLAVGEHILSTRTIPRVDVFSHTMIGQPFVPYEWLAEVASAASFRVAGAAGVALLHGAALGLAFALVYGQLRRRGAPVLLAVLVTLIAAAASAIHWLARPHVFTILGAAAFLRVLDAWHSGARSRRSLWALPAIMALWVNAHGGFLIGLILITLYGGADLWRAVLLGSDAARRRIVELSLAGAATVAATLVIPVGPEIFAHVTGYFGKKMLVNLTLEYMSPDFHAPDTAMFSVMLLALVLSLGWSTRLPALHEGLLVGCFTWFALYSARNIPLFAVACAPVLASQLGALRPAATLSAWASALQARVSAWIAARNAAYQRIEAQTSRGVVSLACVLVLLTVAAIQAGSGDEPLGVGFDPRRQPVAAAQYLKAHPPTGRAFNDLRWGGYLLHELWPAHRVFIDGQTDFYGVALTQEWLDVVELKENWLNVLQRYEISWAIQPTDSALVRALAAQPGWIVTYQDATATVLERRNASL